VTTESYAAAITPLKDGGSKIDDSGIAEYVRFLAQARLDGVMVTGTAGEGLLLSGAERRQVAERFIAAAPPGFRTLVQCGAQTTSETTDLANHAAAVGAAGVLVICPPYFPLDAAAQHAFLGAAAAACAPVPFGVYELAQASGYAVSHDVIRTLREEHPNFEMIKISDVPWENFSAYLRHDLRAFCGPEGLIGSALQGGAVGVISALAAAFPNEVVRAVHERDEDQFVLVQQLRACIDHFPRQAALKALLCERGVPIEETVRPPLRALTSGERAAVIRGVDDLLGRDWRILS
jgi:dihydrodipicolinate synthase/N-acetylneuraminate lyase